MGEIFCSPPGGGTVLIFNIFHAALVDLFIGERDFNYMVKFKICRLGPAVRTAVRVYLPYRFSLPM